MSPEEFYRFLDEQQAEAERRYTTPRWERVMLRVVLVALALVVLSGVVTALGAGVNR